MPLEPSVRHSLLRAAARLRFYAPYAWRFTVLRQARPLIYGLAITDRCSMACRGCAVSNTGRPDMTWDRLTAVMREACRFIPGVNHEELP